MRLATQSSTQLHTIFGSGYVLEQRGDQSQRHLPQCDDREPVLDFGQDFRHAARRAVAPVTAWTSGRRRTRHSPE